MKYYPIDEALARRAKEMNSYSDYVEGSATASYQSDVDAAARIAEQQKRKVDPIHHEKIDRLLDTYARKLAENVNRSNAIAARVPSILIAGGGNFPVRKKEKQNRADEAAMEEWRQIQGILDKIRGTGKGGISADDPEAVQKLKVKLERLEQTQTTMKAVNAYYRKNKTLDGCPHLSTRQIKELNADMARSWRAAPKPYESYTLTNNSAAIRQVKARIEELTRKAEKEYEGWAFDGGTVSMDRQANRLRVFFDEKPDRGICDAMRHGGFRWAPSVGAWQRQLTNNAIWTAKHMDCLRPLSAEPPTQARTRAEPVSELPQETGNGWGFYIVADLKTWTDNAGERSESEHYASFEETKARFDELRREPYNSEAVDPDSDGQPPARLTLGLESADGMIAADILQVRQGKNYLITDFTRTEGLRDDPTVMSILSRVSCEIGFDFVRDHEQAGGKYHILPNVPFDEWDNPYFEAATPGSIAARFYELGRLCEPDVVTEDGSRKKSILSLVQLLQKEGKAGARELALTAASLAMDKGETVREQANAIIRDLTAYRSEEKPPEKGRRRSSPER